MIMAHYPNQKGEYKTKQTLIKWYPSDLVEIDRQAKEFNLTRTEYIARCVLDNPVEKNHIFKVNWQTYRVMGQVSRELNQIGNNINQIAKVLHTERLEGGAVPAHYPLPEELSAICTYVSSVNKELNMLRLLMVDKDKK
jgi:hypothetical protein